MQPKLANMFVPHCLPNNSGAAIVPSFADKGSVCTLSCSSENDRELEVCVPVHMLSEINTEPIGVIKECKIAEEDDQSQEASKSVKDDDFGSPWGDWDDYVRPEGQVIEYEGPGVIDLTDEEEWPRLENTVEENEESEEGSVEPNEKETEESLISCFDSRSIPSSTLGLFSFLPFPVIEFMASYLSFSTLLVVLPSISCAFRELTRQPQLYSHIRYVYLANRPSSDFGIVELARKLTKLESLALGVWSRRFCLESVLFRSFGDSLCTARDCSFYLGKKLSCYDFIVCFGQKGPSIM